MLTILLRGGFLLAVLLGLSAQSAQSKTAALALQGQVYTDVPVIGAQVQASCARQSGEINAKTDKAGKFLIKARNAELPCQLQASGGFADGALNALKLRAIAHKNGIVNINLVTDLALEYALQANHNAASGDAAQKPVTQKALAEGLNYVRGQLGKLHLPMPDADIFDKTLKANGNNLLSLEVLSENLAVSQRAFKYLVDLSAKRADWGPAFVTAPSNWQWKLPPALPEPKVPVNNPMSVAKAELGRYLFYDVRLSGNQKFSCASCHHQNKAFTDGLPVAIGSTGQKHPRSSMSLGNVAYNVRLTWANPTDMQLEQQINMPLFGKHPVEMGINEDNKQEVIGRIQADAFYQKQFKLAFPAQDNAIRWDNIKKAISTFQRTLLTGESRYDKHSRLEKGVPWSESEERGYVLFISTVKCFACHGSFNFNDSDTYLGGPPPDIRFHNTGLFNIGGSGAFPKGNRGIFEFTKKRDDMGKFRAPSLRNVAVTAPYMHDGSIPTLEAVLDFYADHGRNIKSGPHAGDGRKNRFKSKDVDEIKLSAQDKADIVAFLKTLTDEEFLRDPRFSDPFKQKP